MTDFNTPLHGPAPIFPILGDVTGEPVTDNYDDPVDVSDFFADEFPEDDLEVLAYFNHNRDHGQANPTLSALAFMENGQPVYRAGAWASEWLGADLVIRLEGAESERLNG